MKRKQHFWFTPGLFQYPTEYIPAFLITLKACGHLLPTRITLTHLEFRNSGSRITSLTPKLLRLKEKGKAKHQV